MEDEDFISKTRRKQRMTELQDIGAALVKLSNAQLKRMDLPEDLREAVLECKRFTRHEAIRRQMQYIGKIMRHIDAGPIAARLEAFHAPSQKDTALFHLAEKWRDDMLRDPSSIGRFAHEFPAADPKRLQNLVDAARKEREAERAPKHFRELFHIVNTIVQDHARRP
ncbi:MAG TPA: ribosome biogenesis factor YjgA [Usitatibacter sp.]|nr:ribosome biogenesis factor YjgA [Usitatibacter sp.]